MKLNLILARSRNGVIGCNNTLPWHVPEDLAYFKKMTSGSPVIMGRKTWDSLPARFRPLPGRLNVVITRQANWSAEGAVAAHTIAQACDHCRAESTAWIIGGAELYAQALPMADTAVITEIDADYEGDAFAPQFGPEWREQSRQTLLSAQGLTISFITLNRKQNV